MRQNKIFKVATIGVPDYELRVLKSIFSLTSNRLQSYIHVEASAQHTADIIIVNADDPSILTRNTYSSLLNLDIPVVKISRILTSSASDSEEIIRRPLTTSQVINALDRLAIGLLGIIPEINMAADNTLQQPYFFDSAAESTVKPLIPPLRYTVLVADADAEIRQQLDAELRLLGLQADFASTGSKALQLLNKAHYGAVLLDTTLPDIDGYLICKTIKKHNASNRNTTPVILLATKRSPFDRLKAKMAGCDAYLAKPINREQLQNTLINQLWLSHAGDALQADTLLDQVQNLLVVYDRAGNIIRFNAVCERLTGFSFAEIEGQLFWQVLVAAAEREAAQQAFHDLLATHDFPHQHEQVWLTRTASQRRIEWTSTAISNHAGVVEYIVSSGTDITERNQHETQLKEKKKRFKDFAETAADWFWEMDAELRFSYLSEHYQHISGVNDDQLLGTTASDFFNNLIDPPQQLQSYLETLTSQKPFTDFEFLWQRPDSTTRVLRISGKPMFASNSNQFLGYRGIGNDITKSHQQTQQLAHQASHDPLTGLVNRREFERRLQRVLDVTQANPSEHALFYLDLDKFKHVNDSHGHAAGDELLRQLSHLLKNHIRQRDTLARLGGDEFAILIEHSSLEAAIRVASSLLTAIKEFRFDWENESFGLGASIGLVIINEESETLSAVIKAADSACYIAKNMGGNRIYVNHDGGVEPEKLRKDQQWAVQIKRALAENRFRLDFQPIVPLSSSNGTYIELLLRMIDEHGNTIMPRSFFDVAEKQDLATKLDCWVVNHTLNWLANNPQALESISLCFINLTGASLRDDSFLGFVIEQFNKTKVPAEKICFEITETATQNNLPRAILFIKALKNLGCRFSLDNFGHGRFSFSSIKNLPVDFLKIDQVFVKHVTGDPINFTLVKSIHEISQVLGKKTIAEFVEDEATLEKLREIGISYVQGYLTGKPQAINEAGNNFHSASLLSN